MLQHSFSSVALSADGRTVVAGSDDKAVRIWTPGKAPSCRVQRAFTANDCSLWSTGLQLSGSTTLAATLKEILMAGGAHDDAVEAEPSAPRNA